jgi:hypothetical protein
MTPADAQIAEKRGDVVRLSPLSHSHTSTSI